MGKIRLQDLARRMNVPEQDLMFKLKSIGVRVEGEDAAIDSDIIQAILQGKKLPQPREVILRDDSAEETPRPRAPRGAPPRQPSRRPPPSRLRPGRRSLIQRVEKPIQEIPVRERPAAVKAEPAAPEMAEETAAAAEATVAEEAKADKKADKPEKAAAEKPEEKPEKAAAEKPEEKPEAAAEKKVAAKKVEPVVKKPAKTKVLAKKVEPAATAPEKSAGRPARRTPGGRTPGGRTPGGRTPGGRTPGGRTPGGRTPSRPSRRAIRAAARSVAAKHEPPEQRKPASARGQRRAQRREESQGQPTAIHFKEDRPEGPVTVTQHMTVRDFAEKLGVKAKDLIKVLLQHGVMANINKVLDPELAKVVADELGVEILEVTVEEEVQLQHEIEKVDGDLEKAPRAPVVTVMGHVDHGKTTLLDAIRETKVVEGEAGGITQHIGAYLVESSDRPIVFLDTPGHEAFTMMRARGAGVTDIVVLVVAADDGVMPQTMEAIDHAKAAGVPIVVAINKVDKPNANLDRVKKELADRELMVEDWGGDTVSVPLSALKKEGIDELLEMILITADLLELKATPELPANGVILEARKEVGRGIVGTMLVQDGTLEIGDVFVAGATWGRVRSMMNDRGERLKKAGPSTPVEVTGFNDVPSAGDTFQVFADEGKARDIAGFRSHEERQRELAPQPGKMSLEQLFSQLEEEEVKELPVVVKADVHGSVEVVRDTLEKLSSDKVRLKVIHAGVGAVSTNDVLLASASEAIIVGFNVRPERNAATLAEKEQVDVRLHTVIYELSDEVKRAMTGLLEPTFQERQTGTAEIRETFKVPKIGVVAGCYVTDGVIPRNAEARLLRDNRVIWEGKISSLRRFKDDVSEVRSGFECGIGLEGFQDVKPGDEIEAFVREEVAASL